MRSNIDQGCTAKTWHNTLSDCAYLFKNLRFLTVSVSEIVELLKKYIQSLIMSFGLVLSIFPKQLVRRTPGHKPLYTFYQDFVSLGVLS